MRVGPVRLQRVDGPHSQVADQEEGDDLAPWLGLYLLGTVGKPAITTSAQDYQFTCYEIIYSRDPHYLFDASRMKTVCMVVCTSVMSEERNAVRCLVSWKKEPMMQKLE